MDFDARPPIPVRSAKHARAKCSWVGVVSGFAYVTLSLGLSVVYLTLLQPAFSNDLWWPHYNVTVHQALLIDLFNVALATQANGTIDLLAPWAVIDKSYDSSVATAAIYPTYVRRLIWAEFTSVEYAVVNLRSLSGSWSLWMCTQYCWVDLQRQFEVAHTTGRQQRCADRYSANGAVYMETMLRNQNWDDFVANYGGDGGVFTLSVQAWANAVPGGSEWLAATASARLTTSVAQEIAYWRAQNITSYMLQWQNRAQGRVSESVVVENALGMQQDITLKNLPLTMEAWTSYTMYWFPLGDFTILKSLNLSLIPVANDTVFQLPPVDYEVLLGLQDNDGDYVGQIETLRTSVGPFNSIDSFYVPVPAPLIRLYAAYIDALYELLSSQPNAGDTLNALGGAIHTPTPPSWANLEVLYYGGSPLCLFGQPEPYVQESFNFYDTCATQRPLTVALTQYSSVFVALTTGMELSNLCSLSTASCQEYFQRVVATAALFRPVSVTISDNIPAATTAVNTLNIGMMQFASNVDGTNWTLLFEPVLEDPRWAIYGWSFLYDWVEGKREVVSFEGEGTSIVLISSADAPLVFPSSTNKPTSATQYIYYFVVYTSALLALVACMCFSFAAFAKFQIHGPNLFWFNRVVGSVWLGRPLLFVRGFTAVILLSTSQLEPIQLNSTHSRFALIERPWFMTILVCGEATWILYVAHDLLTVAFYGLTSYYGPLSCVLAWMALVVVDTVWPVQPIALLRRVCASQDMDQAIACSSGSLQIGSFGRVCLVLGLQTISCVLAFGLVWTYHRLSKRSYPGQGRHTLGVADAFFVSSMSSEQHKWSIDCVSCVMAGLIPLTWDKKQYTVDIKLWTLLVDRVSKFKHGKSFVWHNNTFRRRLSKTPSATTDNPSSPLMNMLWRVVVTIVVVGYAGFAIFSSVSYHQVSQVNLANDMFWASFNMTGAHMFIANWFNRQLLLNATNVTIHLNADTINQDGMFDEASAPVQSAANFGSLMQHTDLNTIEAAIVSLRHSDGCSVPWIFSQYCFVDFDQRWHMANSATRQARCQAMVANGAVFLEPALRNIDFNGFHRCWGTAFDVAIASEVKSTDAGRSWLATIQSHDLDDIPVEVAYWQKYNVARFETQWQNFKRIGLVNMYSVSNMFGTPYPFTLQYQNSSFRMHKATSLKMYWGLANDFVAISHNTSGIGGRSLVRSSPVFAFANTSLESVLRANGTLKT
ncbi:hypothetical protein As57867_013405, partial [Aphanomyces stellatus]